MFLDAKKCSLNTPQVYRLVGARRPHNTITRPGFRLRARARRLSRGVPFLSYAPDSWRSDNPSPTELHWRILHGLCDKTVNHFSIERRLRSHSAGEVELYLLYRMTNQLEEPKRTVARSRLRSIMQFRDMRVPGQSAALVIGALAHHTFKQSLRQFIRQLLLEHRHACIPLHVPHVGVVEARWLPLERLIHNWRSFTANWRPDTTHTCVCGQYRELLPDSAWSSDGHVAIPGSMLRGLSKSAFRAAASNTRETIFPSKTEFATKLLQAVSEFWRKSGLCSQPWGSLQQFESRVQAWVDLQWPAHTQALRTKELHCHRDVKEIQHKHSDLIWHCSDHQHTRLMGYCPALYSNLIYKTFVGTPEVFQMEEALPAITKVALHDALPRGLRQACPWAFRNEGNVVLPAAYVLPKETKGFLKARPVIPFAGFFLQRLHRAVGKVLTDLSRHCIQDSSFNAFTTLGAISKVKAFASNARSCQASGIIPKTAQIKFFNEDISAFFLAPTHSDLIAAARWAVEKYLRSRPIHSYGTEVVFTVFFESGGRRCIASKAAEPRGVRFPLKFLIEVLQHALLASVFTVGGRTFRQIRGAFIGSPLSPSWCTLLAMLVEHRFMASLSTYQASLGSIWSATRYVDNRLIMQVVQPDTQLNAHILEVDCIVAGIRHPDFYGETINMELESGMNLVGVQLWTDGLYANGLYIVGGFEDLVMEPHRLVLPVEWLWKYRSIHSAGSQALQMSGFLTRAHLALRLSFPVSNSRRALARLVAVFLALGNSPQVLLQCLQRLATKYRNTLNRSFHHVLSRALEMQDVWMIVNLGE